MKKIICVLRYLALKLRFGKRIRLGDLPNMHRTSSVSVRPGGKLIMGSIHTFPHALIAVVSGTCRIGNAVGFNQSCIVVCRNEITIGDRSSFGPHVCLYDHDHCFDKNGLRSGYKLGKIVIGQNCWIGANSVILRDTVIGDGCIIGAGCVVKGEIPPHSIVTAGSRKIEISPIR